MGRDLRFALRALWRQPGFSLLTVIILALGLGAATAMFSLLNTLMLSPMPFPEPDRLVRLLGTAGQPPRLGAPINPARLHRYRADNAVLEGTAAYELRNASLEEPDQPPVLVWSLVVTGDFFSVLGVRPALGRVFSPADDQQDGGRVVVLSAKLWASRFGSDPGIVGRRLRVFGETVTVIGVMPPQFNDPARSWARVDLWRPLVLTPAVMQTRSNRGVDQAIARLKPGVTLAAAEAHLGALARRVDDDGRGSGVSVRPLHNTGSMKGAAEDVALVTMGLALFVLLLACTNLAGLQLARLAARGHEHAIRVALGAGRGHLVRLVVTESLILSVAGGGLGVLVARWCTGFIGPRLIAGNAMISVGIPIELDVRVLAFAFTLVLLSTLLVGLVPAWMNARAAVSDRLRKGGRTTTGRASGGLRQGLVVAQMALALVLLAGGGLFVGGLQRFVHGDPGWRVDEVLTGRVYLTAPRYPDRAARAAFVERLRLALAGLPGVNSGMAGWVPVAHHSMFSQELVVEGRPDRPLGSASFTNHNPVSDSYFRTVGLTLIEGRLFDRGDGPGTLPVAIIDQSLARALWPDQSPLGKRMGMVRGDRSPPTWRTIVGVVSTAGFPGSLDHGRSAFQSYLPIDQAPPSVLTIVLRSPGAPEALVPDLRRAVAAADPGLPVFEPLGARQLADRALANFRLIGWVLVAFALLGLMLSALGVYSLFAGFVTERTREIGVRVALGAQTSQVMRLILGKGLRLAVLGAALGLLGALAVGPVLMSVVSALPAQHPLSIILLAVLLVAVALLACWLPARRAARLDPLVALRAE